ncbi:hypothetical protein B0H13DRAFT_2379013 [Mycena leptocephala]|nr:hypothetical protein B0H13DRAFT_2379013 [Mycena leptocephala]
MRGKPLRHSSRLHPNHDPLWPPLPNNLCHLLLSFAPKPRPALAPVTEQPLPPPPLPPHLPSAESGTTHIIDDDIIVIDDSPSLLPIDPPDLSDTEIPQIDNHDMPLIISTFYSDQGLFPGVRLSLPESAFRCYPWQLHTTDNLLYDIQWVGQSGELYVRAKKCHKSGLAKGPCGECKFLSSIPDVQRLVQRTSGPLPVTRNLKYYNHFQLADVVHEKNEEMNLPKLKKRAISEITNRISLSIRGMYHVKSFTENNMDIQRLVLSFGGPKLCYALAKALNLPSVHTVQSKSNFPTIRPCVGFPLCKEIEANLDSVHDTQVFWERGKPLPCRGFSLLIDEIALEQRPKYDTDRDCVVGFSRFDAASGDMYHPTEETLGEMVDAIREGTLTRATEATVTAIAPFHPDLYTPVPLLISGTCKRETDRLQTKWILEIIKTWTESPNGAAFYGPLWSIASDGDAVRRRALHTIAWRKHYPLLAPFIRYSRRSLS